MPDDLHLVRLWRESADAGLTIRPVYHRDRETGQLLDHAYAVTGPGTDEPHIIITDLADYLADWLAVLYRDPAARAQAAESAVGLDVLGHAAQAAIDALLGPANPVSEPWEYAARYFDPPGTTYSDG